MKKALFIAALVAASTPVLAQTASINGRPLQFATIATDSSTTVVACNGFYCDLHTSNIEYMHKGNIFLVRSAEDATTICDIARGYGIASAIELKIATENSQVKNLGRCMS